MKSNWLNVKRDNSLVTDLEKTVEKKTILNAFESAIELGGWEFITWSQSKKAPYQCVINDGKQNIDVLLYLKNITNAGWEDKPHIKRIQVGNDQNIDFSMLRNQNKNKINLIIGYYNYEKPIFAAWDSEEYTRHKTNRSCYITVEDLVNGYKKKFVRTNTSGQQIYVFTPAKLVKYIKNYIKRELPNKKKYTIDKQAVIELAKDVFEMLAGYEKIVKKHWDGRKKIIELKEDESSNWKQMEWPGFYFEHIGKECLKNNFNINGIKYGNTTIDLFNEIPWDLKVHTINIKTPNKIQTNSLEAIYNAVDDYGYIGFIILEGNAEWDDSGDFKDWHDKVKGDKSKYVQMGEEENRNSRRRKKSFDLEKIKIIIMSREDIEKQPSFQQGMKNSNGNIRTEKMLLDLSLLTSDNIIIDENL